MRKKIDFLAILLVILLALSLGMAGVPTWIDSTLRGMPSSDKALGGLLDDLAAAAGQGGAPAVEDFDVSSCGLWEGKADENFNAVLVDEDGTILARTGTLALRGHVHARHDARALRAPHRSARGGRWG